MFFISVFITTNSSETMKLQQQKTVILHTFNKLLLNACNFVLVTLLD
jgi:hypothetical protein